ncbi:RDD family protein [Nocardioides abyssi]|uniref:RDD family protein n=1 Tax=Nocardioides abyssi TaxID=3058370 RepID=A0ABT8EWW1_9ACTN|nr:RDD family protein [Nocardioides abyssi]MDN4162623.1 RDD family protein [Nocardioides abyssi]
MAAPDAATTYPAAELDRRFYAFTVDRLVAWGAYAVAALAAWWFLLDRGRTGAGIGVIVGTVVLVSLVFSLLLGLRGTSPGRALLGLRVVHDATGTPIGVPAAMLRSLVLGVAALPTFGFGLGMLAWTAVMDGTGRRRGAHDRLTHAVVVDVRPAPVVVEEVAASPRQVVNLTAMRLVPAPPPGVTTPAAPPRTPRPAAPQPSVAPHPVVPATPAPRSAPVPAPATPARGTATPSTPPPASPPPAGPASAASPAAPAAGAPTGPPPPPPAKRRKLGPPLVDAPAPSAEEVGTIGQHTPAPAHAAPTHADDASGTTPAPAVTPAPAQTPTPTPATGGHTTAERTVIRAAGDGPARWRVAFDSGESFVVEGLLLVGRRPEARPGEPVRHLVPLRSSDMSLSKTHAQLQVAADGVLVVMDRGSTNGSVLVRQGVSRALSAGKPATLLPGDLVRFGDRQMTVAKEG